MAILCWAAKNSLRGTGRKRREREGMRKKDVERMGVCNGKKTEMRQMRGRNEGE
jgi:hypothetical protein